MCNKFCRLLEYNNFTYLRRSKQLLIQQLSNRSQHTSKYFVSKVALVWFSRLILVSLFEPEHPTNLMSKMIHLHLLELVPLPLSFSFPFPVILLSSNLLLVFFVPLLVFSAVQLSELPLLLLFSFALQLVDFLQAFWLLPVSLLLPKCHDEINLCLKSISFLFLSSCRFFCLL